MIYFSLLCNTLKTPVLTNETSKNHKRKGQIKVEIYFKDL